MGGQPVKPALRFGLFVAATIASLAPAPPAPDSDRPPAWAYPVDPPGAKAPADDGTPRHVPGSKAAYTLTQVSDLFFAPDWHPSEHPPMPPIVARGRKPAVYACGFCHRADGPGGPENASLAGLPADYLVQQMADFKSGARKTSVPERLPPKYMIALSQAVTDAEVKAAAAYFSALEPRTNIRVVEAERAPKTFVTSGHLAAVKSGEMEPLGRRIVEVPADLEQFVSRDTHAQFTAYVPRGSLERGEKLMTTARDDDNPACTACHGADLRGDDTVPGIAGRSPSYLVRQLFDFKNGARAGFASGLMRPAVEKLSLDDMIALAAYAASLQP